MKQQFKIVILLFLLFTTNHHIACAQCGVTAIIRLTGTAPNVNLDGLSSVALTNWSIYKYEWEVNNIFRSNQSVVNQYGPNSDFDKICLKVYGTNSTTGDSCANKRCNAFYNPAGYLYPEISVQQTGTYDITVDFNVPIGLDLVASTYFEWGDGNTSIPVFGVPENHTYTAAGDYLLKFKVYDNSVGFDYSTTAIVHIANGKTNFSATSLNVSGACPLSTATATSTPPFKSCDNSILLNNYPFNGFGVATSGVQLSTSLNVPGVLPALFTLNDSTNGYRELVRPLFIPDDCITPDTASGIVWFDADADGIFDSNESGILNKEVTFGRYSMFTDSSGFYSDITPHAVNFVSLKNVNSNSITFPPDQYYNFQYSYNSNHPNSNFGIANLTCVVSGQTFIDANHDGIYNIDDSYFSNVTISIHNAVNGLSYNVATDVNGNYNCSLPSGNYSIVASASVLDSAMSSPDTIFVNAVSGNYYNNDFAFTGALHDPSVHVYCSQLRPGFPASVVASVINQGMDSTKVTVTINYDPSLIYEAHHRQEHTIAPTILLHGPAV